MSLMSSWYPFQGNVLRIWTLFMRSYVRTCMWWNSLFQDLSWNGMILRRYWDQGVPRKSQYSTSQSWLARESRRTPQYSSSNNIPHSSTETKKEEMLVSSISPSCLCSTYLLIHNRSMISTWEIQSMDILRFNSLKFWNIVLDELAVCIEFFWL